MLKMIQEGRHRAWNWPVAGRHVGTLCTAAAVVQACVKAIVEAGAQLSIGQSCSFRHVGYRMNSGRAAGIVCRPHDDIYDDVAPCGLFFTSGRAALSVVLLKFLSLSCLV